jgi:abequosyltransferase
VAHVLLSICIPTHNFGQFISDTLRSVIQQAGPSMEIVVLDSASTDNTRDVVTAHRSSSVPIHYHYQSHKGGIDADMARVVELARGEYCWLLSADDALVNGAIRRIFAELQERHEIYLSNRIWCDKELNPITVEPWLGSQPDATFRFSDHNALKKYFRKATSIGALFSYMSSIIVNRAAWLSSRDGLRLKGTNYAHVYRLFSIALNNDARVRYLADPLIMCRGDNDSFMAGGVVARHLIDLNGYEQLARHLFADARMQKAFKAVMRRQHRWFAWVWLLSSARNDDERAKIALALRAYGYGVLLTAITTSIARSRVALTVARGGDRAIQIGKAIARRRWAMVTGRTRTLPVSQRLSD